MSNKNLLVVLCGPTAVGKTDLAIELALAHNASIISADSRQFYKEMNIGTAVPSQEQMEHVPHHFIHSHSIHNPLTAGQFEKEVSDMLPELFKLNPVQFLVGGSGLYIHAVTNGLDEFPDTPNHIKKQLNRQLKNEGLEHMVQELKRKDYKYFDVVDKQNKRRVMRALEVIETTGKPFSEFLSQNKKEHDFDILKIVIHRDREELYERINLRVDQMIESGLEKEVQGLFEHQHLAPLQTVGYKELFEYLGGYISREQAIELIKRNSRRYAKRQLTWFRRDKENNWVHASQTEKLKSIIAKQLKS